MIIALVGASNNEEKYGNKILKDLLNKGHKVIPINPREKEIEGIKCHTNLGVIGNNYDIINFVVKPEITFQILEKYRKKILKKQIWCQPGAADEKIKGFLENHHFKGYVTDSCIMLEDIN
ncbi:MAG: CoA-binding protein [Candidatus Gracilibacteria bacterium]